jgi:hypothetical protein
VKKVTLRLIETLVDKCEDAEMVAAQVGWGKVGHGWVKVRQGCLSACLPA